MNSARERSSAAAHRQRQGPSRAASVRSWRTDPRTSCIPGFPGSQGHVLPGLQGDPWPTPRWRATPCNRRWHCRGPRIDGRRRETHWRGRGGKGRRCAQGGLSALIEHGGAAFDGPSKLLDGRCPVGREQFHAALLQPQVAGHHRRPMRHVGTGVLFGHCFGGPRVHGARNGRVQFAPSRPSARAGHVASTTRQR